MVRIGFDAKRVFKNQTGLGNYGRMVVEGLSRCRPDYDIVLFTPSSDGIYKHLFDNSNNVSVVEPHGIANVFSRCWRLMSYGVNSISDLSIFHGLSQELPVKLQESVKKVVTIHDLIAWRYPQYFSVFDRNIYKAKISRACRVADSVVAVSQQTADDLVNILNVPSEKIRVIYQSCNDIFRHQYSENQIAEVRKKYGLPKKYVVCVGTIEQRKNQVSVVRMLKYLPDDVQLVLVGRKTSYYGDVESVISAENLANRVVVVDNVDFKDLPIFYSQAEVSVYMSLFEGFGIPVLESLTCGTPVVTSNLSSMPEAGGDAALYANPENPYEIASQCMNIIGNSDFRAGFQKRAENHCAKFHPEKIISELINLYESLVK